MNNLALRLLSALILLPLVITAFVVGGWWLKVLVILCAAAAFFEYGAVVSRGDNLARGLSLVTGVGITALGVYVDSPVLGLVSLQFAFAAAAALFVLRPGADLVLAFRHLAGLAFGVLWIVPGFVALSRLRDLGDTLPPALASAAPSFILAALTATWANDTCAYFAGRFLGKHKMAGPISPKKTWEGFVGGAIGTPLFLLGGRLLFPGAFAAITVVDVLFLSVPASFLGPIGDLTESLWKRAFDVKDSGNIIPGHGGMLDRVDAVFFVAPWALTYFAVIKPYFF